MITIEKKKEIVALLVEKFKDTKGIFFCDFAKMSVAEVIAIRRQFKEKDANMLVAKNTLILRALAEIAGLDEVPAKMLFGQTALILSDDPTAPAKIIKQVFDKTEKLRLKAALIEGTLYEGKQLNTIAALPSRSDLIAGILGSINAPASGIVGAINATIRDLASVIEEAAKKQNVA